VITLWVNFLKTHFNCCNTHDIYSAGCGIVAMS